MLTIFDKNGQMRTAIEPSDNSTQTKEVQGENLLNLSFTHYEHIPLDVLDYVDFEGERYWLLEKYAPKQINSQEWSYDLKMYGADSLIKRFLVLETTDGNAEPIFTLTATPREHAQMVLNCINAGMGNSTPWQLGQVDGENLIVIDYNGTYCNEALTQIVEAIGGKTEWWFDAQTLNICRCESGDEITLAYGNGLTELERDTSNIAKFYTRLFPIGSDRNIDPEKYGYFRLMLPGKKKYVEIQTEEYGVFDHFEREAFADIYPRRIGTVSEVRSEDVTDENGTPFTIYYFKDDTLDFDPNQYELPNETKRISFQDGDLAGMGETDDHYFECNYNSDTREFELITIWPYDSDMQLPGGNIIPRAGDHYILWNITMPDEYYTLAEQELQQAVEQYNAEHWFDLSVYKGTTDHVWMEMEGKNLFLGRRVRLENQKYFPETGFRNSRITKITRKVNLPLQMDIEISDAVHAGTLEQLNGSLSQIEEEVESNSKKAEQYRKEAQDFTVRRFRDTQETIRLLENAMLANFTSSVSPLSVHTMAALVGDESLQFRFIDNNGNTVLCDIAYSNTTHQLTAPKSILQHLTLGIDTITSDRLQEEYKTWNLEAYTSPAIISETDTNKAFYLYAKVSKTENTGVYLLTDKAVAMEEAVGSYHLLIGILNSEYNGERSFVTLYGFTEILPGRITTDKIVSGDGKTYFDLANSEIGGNIKFKSTSGEYKGIEEGMAESIDGIETGTRNLILDSLCDKKIPSLATTGGYTTGGLSNMTVGISDEVLYNGKPTLKIQNKPTYYSNQLYIQFDRYNRTDTKLDVADYVFSCMMYVPETYPDRFSFENRVGLYCYNGSTESGNDSYVHVDYDPSKKGTWQKLVAKVPYVKPADGATDWCFFRIRSTNSTTQGTGDPSLCCLYIAEIQLVKGNQAGTWTPAPEDAQAELQAAIAAEEEARNAALAGVATEMAGLQEQIDGQIESWFESYDPTTINDPAKTWLDTNTEEAHMNDTFTNLETGASWRWGINTQTGTYAWIPIADTATQKALQEAAKAQSTADGKSTTYLSKPTSYSVGDLWILESDTVHTGGKKGDVLTANATRSSYIASDWSKQVRYTDDTLAETAKNLADAAKSAANNAQAAINSLNSDNIFSVVEKKSIRVEWESISGVANTTTPAGSASANGTYKKTIAATSNTNVSYSTLTTAFEALRNQLSTYNLYDGNNTTLSAGFKTVMANKFASYYDAEVSVMKAVQEAYTTKSIDEIELGAKNLIPFQYLLDWNNIRNGTVRKGEDEYGEYYEIFQPYYNAYIGNNNNNDVFQGKIKYEDNTQYVLKVRWRREENDEAGRGAYFRIKYTDGTYTDISPTLYEPEVKSFVSKKGKTISIITGSYGAGTYTYIYNILLVEGNKVPSGWIDAVEDVEAKVSELDYLKEALQGTTEIDGGLVLTNVIQLKNAAGTVTGGMNGLNDSRKNVFLWGGGTLAQALAENVITLIRRDGSGFFAGGKMKWGTDGSFQVGIFQVYQDRIVVSGDNGESITITNLPISDVQSNAQTINIGTGLSGTQSTGSFNNTSTLLKNRTLGSVTASSAGKGNYILKGSVSVVLNLTGGSFTGSGLKPTGVSMSITITLSVIIGSTTVLTKTICNHVKTQGWGETDRYTYTTTLDGESFVYSGSSGSVVVKAVITGFSCGVINSSGNYVSIGLSTTSPISMVSTTKETIIAKDGLVVRTDSEHYFSADISENTIKVIMKGLPTSATESGQLYRDSSGNLKIY